MNNLSITYGTSRGRDTYGYTLVTLKDNDTGKRYRASGGGYDMRGTVFADWLCTTYQTELMDIAYRAGSIYRDNRLHTRERDWRDDNGNPALYGMYFYAGGKRPHVSIDGACGFDSVRTIAEAIGLDVRYWRPLKNVEIVTVSRQEVTA